MESKTVLFKCFCAFILYKASTCLHLGVNFCALEWCTFLLYFSVMWVLPSISCLEILVFEMTYYMSTYLHPFNGPFSGTTRVSRYQKGKTSLDITEASDSEWQWHQLGHMQVCTSLRTDNHASTLPLSFLQARRPSCHPSNSVKALKAKPAVYQVKC